MVYKGVGDQGIQKEKHYQKQFSRQLKYLLYMITNEMGLKIKFFREGVLDIHN